MGDSDSLSFNQIQGTQTISLLFEYFVFIIVFQPFCSIFFNFTILKFVFLELTILSFASRRNIWNCLLFRQQRWSWSFRLVWSKSISWIIYRYQCLGSGSVGSARFWLPGSESAKICGSTAPDQRGKISTKNWKKNFFTPKTQIWTFEKERL